jgi:hypothetical protein
MIQSLPLSFKDVKIALKVAQNELNMQSKIEIGFWFFS